MPFPVVTSSTAIGRAPVRSTTYGQYNYYSTPQTIGRPVGGGTAGGMTGSGSRGGSNPAAESFYNDVLSGKQLPFSPFAKSQMLSQQSDMSAAAEGARNQQMYGAAAAGGASANDPSMKAAALSNMAARQTQNQTAARDIDTAAYQANFGAQMGAANQLNANAMAREQWAQQAASGAGVGMPFSPWGSGQSGGGGSTPSNTVGMGLYGNRDPFGYNASYEGVARPQGLNLPWQQSRPQYQTPGIIPGHSASDYDFAR